MTMHSLRLFREIPITGGPRQMKFNALPRSLQIKILSRTSIFRKFIVRHELSDSLKLIKSLPMEILKLIVKRDFWIEAGYNFLTRNYLVNYDQFKNLFINSISTDKPIHHPLQQNDIMTNMFEVIWKYADSLTHCLDYYGVPHIISSKSENILEHVKLFFWRLYNTTRFNGNKISHVKPDPPLTLKSGSFNYTNLLLIAAESGVLENFFDMTNYDFQEIEYIASLNCLISEKLLKDIKINFTIRFRNNTTNHADILERYTGIIDEHFDEITQMLSKSICEALNREVIKIFIKYGVTDVSESNFGAKMKKIKSDAGLYMNFVEFVINQLFTDVPWQNKKIYAKIIIAAQDKNIKAMNTLIDDWIAIDPNANMGLSVGILWKMICLDRYSKLAHFKSNLNEWKFIMLGIKYNNIRDLRDTLSSKSDAKKNTIVSLTAGDILSDMQIAENNKSILQCLDTLEYIDYDLLPKILLLDYFEMMDENRLREIYDHATPSTDVEKFMKQSRPELFEASPIP